jgi:hypothetical protein
LVKAYHLQLPVTQRTVANKAVKLYLDSNNQLLIRPYRSHTPLLLTAVETLKLANVLIAHYRDIADEARKYNGIDRPGPQKDIPTGFSGM